MQEERASGWEALPADLLRRVVHHLHKDWFFSAPAQARETLLPIRATCRAWRAGVDADTTHIRVTVPPLTADYLTKHFPNVSSLDLSRYQRSAQELFPVFSQLSLRQLVLADTWDPPSFIPTQHLTQLTHLSFLAEGLLVPHIASQFCQVLARLTALRQLHLSRLQLPAQMSTHGVSQQLGQTLAGLPHLVQLVLAGGAAPVAPGELYMLFNVELTNLRELELTRLGVRTLPLSLTRLTRLTRLAFSGEMLRNVQLRDEVKQLSNLQVLDISANLAEQLPGGVLELTALRELHAGMNRLGMHMHSLSKLEQLEVLVLASNKLLAVHPSLWDLSGLLRLDLGHNNLAELPADVSQLTALTYLNVCHNVLTALPVGLSCLVNLLELDVSLNADMRELPQGLGQLVQLTRLTASNMRLKQLPMDVGGLVSLVHLDVSHNSLHHLTPQLSCLVCLTHLEASDNKLHQSAAVPEELASLTALRVLRLARNRLQSLPEALGCYSQLQVLDCNGNRLTSVPRVVGRCTALQQLLMASNRLRGLTSGIGNLVRLQALDLSHNQYRHLPTMTGDLTQLQKLLLEDNQLEDLPSSCSALVKLRTLTLSHNRLHVLPPAVSRMSGLISLTLANNPLLDWESVVLQLQRQLPHLCVDDLPPLQSLKPARHLELTLSQQHQQLHHAQQQHQLAFTHGNRVSPADGTAVERVAGAAGPWLLQSGGLVQLLQQACQVAPGPPQAGAAQQLRTEMGNGLVPLRLFEQRPVRRPMRGDSSDQEAAQFRAAALAAAAAAATATGTLSTGDAAGSSEEQQVLLGPATTAPRQAVYNPFPWQQMLLAEQQQKQHLGPAIDGASSSTAPHPEQLQPGEAAVPEQLLLQLLDDQRSDEEGLDAAAADDDDDDDDDDDGDRDALAPAPFLQQQSVQASCTASGLGSQGLQRRRYLVPPMCGGSNSNSGGPALLAAGRGRPSYLEVAASTAPVAPGRLVPVTAGLVAALRRAPPGHTPVGMFSSSKGSHGARHLHQQPDPVQLRDCAPDAAAVAAGIPGPSFSSAGSSFVSSTQAVQSSSQSAATLVVPPTLLEPMELAKSPAATAGPAASAAPGEQDDVCSAGGADSGSEDSGSLDTTVTRLGGHTTDKCSSHSCSQSLMDSSVATAGAGAAVACGLDAGGEASSCFSNSPRHRGVPGELVGGCTAETLLSDAGVSLDMSRCPSSSSSGAAAGGGPGLSGAGAADEGAGARACDAGSCCQGQLDTSGSTQRPDVSSAACDGSASAGQRGPRAPGSGTGSRSFTLGVLESAWWGG